MEENELYSRAKDAFALGHFENAASYYQSIAQQHCPREKSIPFYLLAADSWLHVGKVEQAISDCRAAIAIDVNSSTAWRSLGYAFMVAKEYSEAEQALQQSIQLAASPAAYLYLASLCNHQLRFREGETLSRKALDLTADFDEAYLNLGRALKGQGRLDDAINAFETAIRLSPDYSIANYAVGLVLLDKGETKQAEKHLRQCLEIDPTYDQARTVLDQIILPSVDSEPNSP